MTDLPPPATPGSTPPPPPPPAPGAGPSSGGGPRWQGPAQPPPPPPLSPGPRGPDDEPPSRLPWVLAAVAMLALVAVVGTLLALRTGDEPAPVAASPTPDQGPSPAPTAEPTSPNPTPDDPTSDDPTSDDPTSGSPSPAPSELPGGLEDLLGEGGLDDLLGEGGLDDLLGGGGLDQDLLACLAPDGAEPSLEGTPLPDDPEAAIRELSDQVAELRALAFTDPVDLELLTDEELAERVVALTEEDYPVEDSDVDQAILATLGQLGPDVDLRETYLDLLGEQVAGFYDPETGELVARSTGDLAPSDRIIVAHELDHALTDQALGLPSLEGQDDVDALLARQGLVEGDATVLMQQWAFAHLSLVDQLSLAVPQADAQALGNAPYVLQQQLLYPYEAGLSFVCAQYADGGWDAVDAAYDRLPTTTAQVLFPERYAAGEEAEPVDAVTLPGAEELRTTTFGADELQWLLAAPGDDPAAGPEDAPARARAWAGGRLTAWEADTGTTVTLRLAEHPDAEQPLCDSLQDWFTAAFPGASPAATTDGEQQAWEGTDRAGSLACEGEVVTMTVGPDLMTARAVEEG